MERRIVLSHVGARGKGLGRLQMPLVEAFGRDVVNVLYEANEDCVPGIEEWWSANSDCETVVRPYCLWSEDAEIDFHLNRREATSSVFPLNERFAGHYHPTRKGRDLVLGEAAATVEVRRLKARSLDSLVAAGETEPPDFLGLDTQGSEYEILAGGLTAVRRRTVAVLTEVAFDEVYAGQKTFADVHALMLEAGFALAALSAQTYSPYRAPSGARAKAEPLFGDALYLRRPETLTDGGRALSLFKLAAVAASLAHVEYALGALSAAREAADEELTRSLDGLGYFGFLQAMEAAVPAPDGRARGRWSRGDGGRSPLERVFGEHGLAYVADELRKRRLRA